MDVALDEVLHFDVITSSFTTGAAADADSTPTWEIFEEDTDTAMRSGNFTKRTSKTGNYRGTDTLSSANGYEVGKWYTVVASATVGSVAGKGVVQRFRVVPAESSAGVPKVDVSHFGGTAGTFSSGRPEVNTTHWGGTAVGSVTINCNMTQISGDSGAADNAESFFDGTGYAGTNNVIPTVTTVTNGVTLAASQPNYAPLTTLGTNAPAGWINAAAIGTDAINASKLAADAVAEIVDGVWDEAMADHTGSTTYGGRIVRATNSNVTVQITGSNHISADVHAFQADVIDSTAIASSAVTEIQAGLATATELAKVPKQGETRRYTQVAADSGNKTADVSIGAAL